MRRYNVELTGPRGSVGVVRWCSYRVASAVTAAFLEANGSALVITGETLRGIGVGESSTFKSSSAAGAVRVKVSRLEGGA